MSDDTPPEAAPVNDELRADVVRVLNKHFPEIPTHRIALSLPDIRDVLERHLGRQL